MEWWFGDIKKEKIETQFIVLDNNKFIEEKIDITEIEKTEEIIEKINNFKINENSFYKIILVGNRKFNIDMQKLNKSIIYENIIKIKDQTEFNFNLEKIAEENSIKGYFVKELLEKQKNAENKEEIQKAIEIGLEVL